MRKSTLKNRFFSKRLKIKENGAKIEAEFEMYFDFRLGWTLFSVRKLVSRSARSQADRVPLRKVKVNFAKLVLILGQPHPHEKDVIAAMISEKSPLCKYKISMKDVVTVKSKSFHWWGIFVYFKLTFPSFSDAFEMTSVEKDQWKGNTAASPLATIDYH